MCKLNIKDKAEGDKRRFGWWPRARLLAGAKCHVARRIKIASPRRCEHSAFALSMFHQ
jgi:hypothetical protein